ncbi:hypothetical protein ABIE66_003202 [Peribacillus sp. B2I2]|uniref:hypothetical protein n=1 Tax=Peribacillus sp. B2I2 TaxID=3156468 RepID=UPI003516A119
MAKNLFVEKGTQVEGINRAFTVDGVYVIESPHEEEQLLASGKAHEINFPTLEALELTIGSVVKEHEQAKSRLQANPRFRDSESEREYQLEQLELKFAEDIARTKEGYAKELELQERELALKAVTEIHPTDEQTARFLSSTVTQLAYSDTPLLDMQLLRIKVGAMNEIQKATVLAQAGAIKQVINGITKDKNEAESVFADIVNIAKQSNKASNLDLQLRQLQALKARGLDTQHDLYKRAIEYSKKTNVRGV